MRKIRDLGCWAEWHLADSRGQREAESRAGVGAGLSRGCRWSPSTARPEAEGVEEPVPEEGVRD